MTRTQRLLCVTVFITKSISVLCTQDRQEGGRVSQTRVVTRKPIPLRARGNTHYDVFFVFNFPQCTRDQQIFHRSILLIIYRRASSSKSILLPVHWKALSGRSRVWSKNLPRSLTPGAQSTITPGAHTVSRQLCLHTSAPLLYRLNHLCIHPINGKLGNIACS